MIFRTLWQVNDLRYCPVRTHGFRLKINAKPRTGEHPLNLPFQPLLRLFITVHQFDKPGSITHAFDKINQILLIGVGRIAADGVNTGLDGIFFTTQKNISPLGAILLNRSPRGSLGLVTDKQNIGSTVTDQALKVIDDPAPCAHAAGGNDDAGAGGLFQVGDGVQVVLVGIDGGELIEAEWVATSFQFTARLVVPIRLKLAVDLCTNKVEACGRPL